MENKKIDEKISSQLNRMKAMMNYGLKTESVKYSAVEYSRKGADGKTYGIVREGNKFHIKVADVKNPSKSDYNYIGGFVNHKSNMFESFANAQKHFDMKMRSLNEAYGKNGKNEESWNPNSRNKVLNEMTDKMRLEISRQREIMNNANIIAEGKNKGICKDKASCIEKNNIKVSKPSTGTAQNQGGDFFNEKPEKEFSDSQKNNIKGKQSPVLENIENEFLDNTASVNVGSNNSGENAGHTDVNVGGLSNPLGEEEDYKELDIDVTDNDSDIDTDIESSDDLDLDSLDDEDDFSAEADDDLEEFPSEDDEEFEDDSLTAENNDDEIASLRGELDSLRSTIEAIAAKLGVNEFDEDEPLYDDSESDNETSDDEDDDFDVEDSEEEIDVTDEDGETEEIDDEETEVYESRNYRKVMAEGAKMENFKKKAKNIGKKVGKGIKKAYDKWEEGNRRALDAPNATCDDEEWDKFEKKHKVNETELHDWGKHPRYQKEPMTYPNPKMEKKPGQYDEGEGEETTRKPYGKEVGDGKFYDKTKDVKKIVNSIAESIINKLKLKND